MIAGMREAVGTYEVPASPPNPVRETAVLPLAVCHRFPIIKTDSPVTSTRFAYMLQVRH